MVPKTGIRCRLFLAWSFFKSTLRALLGMSPILDLTRDSEWLLVVREGECVLMRTRFSVAAVDSATARGIAGALVAAADDIDPPGSKATEGPVVVGKCNQCQAVITDDEPWHVEGDGFTLCLRCGDQCAV